MNGATVSMRVRVTVAVVVSVVALGALAVVSFLGDRSGDDAPTVVDTVSVPTSAPSPDGDTFPEPSVSIPDEWQPKGSSLYSDRKPTDTLDDTDDEPSSSDGETSSTLSEGDR